MAVLFLILYFISQGLYEHEKFQVGKLITARHLETIFQRGRLELPDRGNLGVLARLLSIKEHQNESLQSLFERITAAAGLTIPEKFDYSGAKTQPVDGVGSAREIERLTECRPHLEVPAMGKEAQLE